MRVIWNVIVICFWTVVGLEAQNPPAAPAWEITVGGGAIALPSYAGSNEHRVFPFPLAKVAYRDRVYVGPSSGGNGMGIGAYALRGRQFRLAGEVGFTPDRPADRGEGLAGMEDRSFVANASLGATYSLGPIQGALTATEGLNDGAGLLLGGQLTFTLPVNRRTIVVTGFGVTLADRKQMRRDFGVTEAEAARRQALIDAGDDRLDADAGTAYAPEGGLHHTGVSLTLIRFLSQHWAVIGIGGIDRLSGEAARSSLVQDRQQYTGGLAVGYRF
jgi:outer membrane scaffolding protein for murein synthesis (MipA/OmpV family)